MTNQIIKITNLQKASDSLIPLSQLVRQYQSGTLRKPDHQRDASAWDAKKQESYIRRIQNGKDSIGCFLTYQLTEDNEHAIGDGAIYLNDGLQRLSAVMHFYNSPEDFNTTKDDALEVLDNYQVTRQHRHYKNHMEAMVDFQAINQGTVLDAYEFGVGHLMYANNWTTIWKEEFDNWHVELSREFGRLSKIPKKRQRRGEKIKRLHDYGLLMRFVTQDGAISSFKDITSNKPNPIIFKANQSVFQRMANWINTTPASEIRLALKASANAIIADINTIQEAYIRHPFPKGTKKQDGKDVIPFASALALLEIGMYCRATNRTTSDFMEFIDKFMRAYDGKYTLAKDGKYQHLRWSLLFQLRNVCEVIGSTLYMGSSSTKSRKKIGRELVRGYDNSHVNPYSTHGDGPTFPELASINRARGAKPVENPPAEYLFGGAE